MIGEATTSPQTGASRMHDTDPAAIDFDREKWRTEIDFRRRELELKEREQANRDAEVEIKRKEQASSTWRSPLTRRLGSSGRQITRKSTAS